MPYKQGQPDIGPTVLDNSRNVTLSDRDLQTIVDINESVTTQTVEVERLRVATELILGQEVNPQE